jgi:hypothetical protein
MKNWMKVDEKPLEPGVPKSPMSITESKDIPGEINIYFVERQLLPAI